MKKFLLLILAVTFTAASFAQVSCPVDIKRNNGNNCGTGGTGGQLELTFAINPPNNMQISQILAPGVSVPSTLVMSSRIEVVNNKGLYVVTWCFETDNLTGVPASSYLITFFLDSGTPFLYEGEPTFSCTQGAPLPVSLRNFNASLRNSNVSLSWITETENNAKGFAVERRMGNGAYVEIGFVNSKAINGTSSSTIEYSFSDANLKPSTIAQYRLRQVDLDGKSTYSEIRTVRNGAKNLSLSVYPNPSRGITNISIPDGVGTVDVSLEDFTGKTIQRYNGINRNNMQLTNMKPGLYVVRVFVRETGEYITERISVQ